MGVAVTYFTLISSKAEEEGVAGAPGKPVSKRVKVSSVQLAVYGAVMCRYLTAFRERGKRGRGLLSSLGF